MTVEKIVEEFVQVLRNRFGKRIESIIFFGSHARGECKDDGDVNVLIVGDVKLDEVIDVAYSILLKYGIYISPIVMSKDYFEMLRAERAGFIENVLRGELLFT